MDDRSVKKPYSDRRWYDDIGGVRPICNFCKHRREFNAEKGIIPCDAFPDGIPRNILKLLKEEKDTTKECNNGIKYEPRTENHE